MLVIQFQRFSRVTISALRNHDVAHDTQAANHGRQPRRPFFVGNGVGLQFEQEYQSDPAKHVNGRCKLREVVVERCVRRQGCLHRPVVIPDISDSLDGHLTNNDFSPLTVGGSLVSEFATLGDAVATITIGASLKKASELLNERTGVPKYEFDSLIGLDATDSLVMALSEISGIPVPEKIERHRAQLEDAMVDTHFMLGQAPIAIAGDADLLNSFTIFMTGMGAEVVAAVTSANSPILKHLSSKDVKIGDLEDLELLAKERNAQLIIGNSHCSETSSRLNIPLLHAGFPLYDQIGGYQRTWIGYRGARQAMFDIANLLIKHGNHEIQAYRSIYSTRPEDREATYGGYSTVASHSIN